MNVMNKNSTLLLDCTLRDGGYYNKWDFDRSTVDRYLTAVKTSSVDVVELGYRDSSGMSDGVVKCKLLIRSTVQIRRD